MPHNYSGYAHGCRCDLCGLAKLEYQREKRAREPGAFRRRKYTEKASKYWNAENVPQSSPEVINVFQQRLRGR
jgi:hypothetical protein